ncbi:MAG: hypothetical protein OXG66_09385 [Acidimicrobiaceae bacterium]|nr:hypothetical protein [Acidimicrobiaceae bacterium]
MAGAHAGGVDEHRQKRCDQQHREPPQGTETHVGARRYGPWGRRYAERERRVAFVGVGRSPALWGVGRSGPTPTVGIGGLVGVV